MSLFKPDNFATKADQMAKQIFAVCSQNAARSFDEFWFDRPNQQTHQKTVKSKSVLQAQCDEMGTDAAAVMTQHAALQGFLWGLRPYSEQDPIGWKVLNPPYMFTKNQDGTVTIGDPIVGTMIVVK